MSLKKKPEERPRREKENMDEPQEEFIDISSIPSHTKEEEEEEEEKTKKSSEKGRCFFADPPREPRQSFVLV